MRKSKRFEISVEKHLEGWRPYFSIDQQTFFISSVETKKEALWYAKCLRHAFKKVMFNTESNPDEKVKP